MTNNTSAVIIDVPLSGKGATLINAGHPAPFLYRSGSVALAPVHADIPFGMFAGTQYSLQTLDLQLGDRLVMVTDGLLERNATNFDIRGSIEKLAHLHPREFVRELCSQVTDAVGGTLADDATVLCFDWHDEPDTTRHSDSGSNKTGASE